MAVNLRPGDSLTWQNRDTPPLTYPMERVQGPMAITHTPDAANLRTLAWGETGLIMTVQQIYGPQKLFCLSRGALERVPCQHCERGEIGVVDARGVETSSIWRRRMTRKSNKILVVTTAGLKFEIAAATTTIEYANKQQLLICSSLLVRSLHSRDPNQLFSR